MIRYMPFLQRAGLISTIAGVLLCSLPAGRAQVNGNATISAPAPVFGLPLTVSTSTQFAGSVSSIRWGTREFINNWDHGRQLQLNTQFFNRFECYNPYEAGGLGDQNFSTTSSRLLSLSASGNRLESETQMAWYLPRREPILEYGDACGDPALWLPCPPYTGPLSDYRIHKIVTIGFAGIPNVIEYLSELFIPEPVINGLNHVTAVLPYDFSSVWSYDIVSKDYRKIRELAGEDDSIKVVATADGSAAMGFYAPEMLQPYGYGAADFWRVVPPDPFYTDPLDPTQPDPNYACVHVGSVHRYDGLFNGPGFTYDRAYLVIGTLTQVKESLGKVHEQFSALDADVFNWHDYVALNGLQATLTTHEAAENHWLTQGIAQGLRASRTFLPAQYLQLNPDVATAFGATNYQGAINHYVGTGRAEGRGTVARPAAGMQHLVVLANRSATAAGQNSYAQLGNGDTSQPSGPTPVAFDQTAVTEIAAGDYASLGVKNNGTVWAWGSNQYGVRGNGGTGSVVTAPVMVPVARASTPTRNGRHAIAVGTACYAVVDTEGQVWMWGANWNGRLGDGTTAARYTPARVKKSANSSAFLTGIVSIAAGGGTMAALDADSTVWTWGAGANGALGNGSTEDSAYPVQVVQAGANSLSTPLVGISQVACGSSGFCIALARNGVVYGWGSNDFSQMGVAPGGAFSIATPIAVGPSGIDVIAAGAAHCIAHSAIDRKVYGWGYNGYGQLGTGSAGVAQYPPAAMNSGPDGMNDIADLAACANFSAMVRYSDRAVFVAGDNQSGQLGLPGNPPAQYLPAKSSFLPAP